MRAAAVSQRPHTCCRLTAGPSLSLLVTNLGSHDNQWHTQVVAQHRWIKGEGHATPTSRRLGRVCRPHLLWIDVSLKVRHHCKETEGKALLIAIDHSILVYWRALKKYIKILISQTNTENKYPSILLGQLCALQRDYIKFWFLRQMEGGENTSILLCRFSLFQREHLDGKCTLQSIIVRPLQFEHTPFVCKLHSLITRGSMPEATSVHIMCNFPLLICPTYQCNFQPSDL